MIVMATGQQLVWRSPEMQAWSAITLPPSIGRPTALTAGPDATLWVGGTLGLGEAELSSGLIHVHPVPFEVPAAVRDLAADRSYLWAATDSGLMRIQ
jgi:ligand-binding sensor domain-containing protein